MDVVRRIQAFNAGREPERLQLKYQRMHGDAFAFFRATCHLFHDRLPRTGVLRSAPLVWACGDLHFENFGSYRGDNRQVYFDLTDFDEAALAPASWDLLRLLTSLWVGAGSLGLRRREVQHLGQALLGAYGAALAEGKAYWIERETAQGLVHRLLDGLKDRKRADFLASRTSKTGARRVLRVDNGKALPASAAQRDAVAGFMAGFAKAQPEPDRFKLFDVARRIAGLGSLGTERFVVLVQGAGGAAGASLLDLKGAQPSSLLPHLAGLPGAVQPRWPNQADRVVALQRRLQAVPMALLQAVWLGDAPCVLRELQPSEDRISLDRADHSLAEMAQVIGHMGRLLAWAQLRSAGRQGAAPADALIDFGLRKKWPDRLMDIAQDLAQQVRRDAVVFDAAFDAGAFAPAGPPATPPSTA